MGVKALSERGLPDSAAAGQDPIRPKGGRAGLGTVKPRRSGADVPTTATKDIYRD